MTHSTTAPVAAEKLAATTFALHETCPATDPVCSHQRDGRSHASRRRGDWQQRLIDVEYGLKWGFRSNSTLVVHLFLICVVMLGGFLIGLSPLQWGVIVVSICSTLAAEMFRSIITTLVSSLASNPDSPLTPESRQTPRVATAAVFLTLIGSTTACILIFAERIRLLLN
ncbi:MAG: diacylglycerol kinase [Planctomycetaceae bacterium]